MNLAPGLSWGGLFSCPPKLLTCLVITALHDFVFLVQKSDDLLGVCFLAPKAPPKNSPNSTLSLQQLLQKMSLSLTGLVRPNPMNPPGSAPEWHQTQRNIFTFDVSVSLYQRPSAEQACSILEFLATIEPWVWHNGKKSAVHVVSISVMKVSGGNIKGKNVWLCLM